MRLPPTAALLLIAFAGCTSNADTGPGDPEPGSGSSGTSPDAGTGTAASEHVYGVTITDTAPLAQIVTSLQGLPHRGTARVVFDENVAATDYTDAVTGISTVADVMGELLDSTYVPQTSTAGYLARTQQYLSTLSSKVAIWEVGNEINGEWVDANAGGTAEVVAKISGAFDLVHGAGGKTALTLYGCSDAAPRYDMIAWATANIPDRMKTGLDYVLVSFYEGDCGVAAPDWQTKFAELRAIFPTAKLGFGEVGAVDASGAPITNPAVAAPYLARYYQLPITVPGYVGGHFWWYYVENMLPLPSSMYTALCDAIR